MALLLCCLVVCVCVCVSSMWSRTVFEIWPDLFILRCFTSIHGFPKPEYQTPSCLMDAHSIAMKNGHQQKSEDILWKIYPFQWMLTCFKLLFCNMKHVSASLEEIHQSAADSRQKWQKHWDLSMSRHSAACKCPPTQWEASLHLWQHQNPCFLFHQAPWSEKHIISSICNSSVQLNCFVIRPNNLNTLDTLC